jgi:PAS domain S-box-containing protein
MPDPSRGAMPVAEEVYRRVVEAAEEFAILIMDEHGVIETWNRGAERVFGWTAAEAQGRAFDFLFTDNDRADGAPQRELTTAREKGRATDIRWHRRADGSLVFTDGVTSAIRDDAGAAVGFSKIARDVTDRIRAEQRLAAQLALTTLLNNQEPLPTVLRRMMEAICSHLAWDAGVFWQVDDAHDEVRCVDVWLPPGIDGAVDDALRGAGRMVRGEGLPGNVLATGRPRWVIDFAKQQTFPRATVAARSGLRSAFAFPVTIEGRVIGVMEFFSRETREPDPPLLPIMELIGAQLGEFIERRRTEEALRDSEERYRVVLETAQDAIFTIDAGSRILFCNPAVERIFGWTPSELIGRTMMDLMPQRLRGDHQHGIDRYLRTGRRHIPWTGVELTGLHKNGEEIPLEISFGEWHGGGRTIFTGFARDITERRRAAEQMELLLAVEQRSREEAEAARAQIERRADEEAAFRHLASALSGAIEMNDVLNEIVSRATVVTRADGVYIERIINDAKAVEVVSASGRGAPRRGLRVAYPGSMTEEIVTHRQPVILADLQRFGRSMAPYLLDSCAQCQVLVTPLIAENEPLGALVLLNSGASGRRFGDHDIIRARTLGDLTSLALRRVRLMEQEREAKEKAEAAVRVRDETLGIVSHDLRNPLTKVALSADLLVDAAESERADLIETIRLASKQMQRLIQDLLDVARVEAGRLSVDLRKIEAAPLVRFACESNQPLAEQKQQRIECSIDGELPCICADRDRIMQVFGNLIGNAMKFAPERGCITVEAFARNGMVTFRVRDSGPGIPDADLKNVFRPYWQAKKTAHMGAGLGLAIVRGIIEAHRGQVWAANAPGGGAEFTFTIPEA